MTNGCIYLDGIEYQVVNGNIDVPDRYIDRMIDLGYSMNIARKPIISVRKSIERVKEISKDKKKLDFMLLTPHIICGGSETRWLQIISTMDEFNVRVGYVGEDVEESMMKKFKECKNVKEVVRIKNESKLVWYCDKEDIDVILFYGTSLPGSAFKNSIRPALILSLNVQTKEHGTDHFYKCVDHLDAVVTVSDKIKEKIDGKHPNIFSIVSGADSNRFTHSPIKNADGKFRVGYVGRFSAGKNVEKIPEAMRGLRNSVFVIAGSKDMYRDGYRKIVDSAKRNAVELEYRGLVSDPERIYNELDIVVLLSSSEGMPMMVVEAAMCGIPVISARVGGLENIFRDGRDIVFIKRDIREAGHVLRELMENPKLRESIGFEARKTALEKLTLERMSKSYKELIVNTVSRMQKKLHEIVIGFYRNGGGGDIVMTEPVIRSIRKDFPDTKFIYECGDEFSCLLKYIGIKRGSISNSNKKIVFKYDAPKKGIKTEHVINQYFRRAGINPDIIDEKDKIPHLNIDNKKLYKLGFHTVSDCYEKNWSRKNWDKLIFLLKSVVLIEYYNQGLGNLKG
jgi:glycosyltransferase involved in cell wall biosynthesis